MQLTPQLAISCLLQSRFWYASSCLSTSFLNALQLTPQLAISCLLQSRFWYVSSYFLFYFAGPNGHSSISCASWTKVLFSTLPTEHPFSISHAFRTMCSLSLNILISCFTLLDPNEWSFQLFCASWTKVLFGTLLTEHPFSISHAFRIMCSLSLNRMSIAKVLSKRDSNPPKN